MADATVQPLVYKDEQGDAITMKAGGKINIGDSIVLTTDGDNLIITGLPAADPSVAGALYTATGAVKVSAG